MQTIAPTMFQTTLCITKYDLVNSGIIWTLERLEHDWFIPKDIWLIFYYRFRGFLLPTMTDLLSNWRHSETYTMKKWLIKNLINSFVHDLIVKYRVKQVEMPGIEPGAFHMQSERSTTELHPPEHVSVKHLFLHNNKQGNSSFILILLHLSGYYIMK